MAAISYHVTANYKGHHILIMNISTMLAIKFATALQNA